MLNKTSDRLITIDLIRGLFLIVIIIDHLQKFPGVFDIITGRGILWVSAAEGFFFVSGLMLGYVRGNKDMSKPFKQVSYKLFKRAGVLYAWSIGLTLIFTVFAFMFQHYTGLKQGAAFNLPIPQLIKEIVTFWYVYGWADFLQYYAVFVFVSPLAIYLLRKNLWYVLITLTVSIWYFSGNNIFLGWQLLFFGGSIVGFYLTDIELFAHNIPRHLKQNTKYILVLLAIITYIISLILVFGSEYSGSIWLQRLRISPIIIDKIQYYRTLTAPYFDKNSLPLPRLATFLLWFSALYILTKRYQKVIVNNVGSFLIPFGQNSLYVYIVHAFFIFFVTLLFPGKYNVIVNLCIEVAVISSLWLMLRRQFLFKLVPR